MKTPKMTRRRFRDASVLSILLIRIVSGVATTSRAPARAQIDSKVLC